jgi:hypothetical protein
MRKMLWKRNTFTWASAAVLAGLGLVLAANAAPAGPPNAPDAQSRPVEAANVPMKHYKSPRWNFALDVPASWNAFPGQPVNHGELIRFMSAENGGRMLVVGRNAYDPKQGAQAYLQKLKEDEEKHGFSHVVVGKARIGSREALTMDFDPPQPDGKVRTSRAYFFIDGAQLYFLGFGATEDPKATFPIYERMAKSFTIGA